MIGQTGTGQTAPFDRSAVRRHRDRAAAGLAAHDFLIREVADRLADRVGDINRRFERAVVMGSPGGALAGALRATGRIGHLCAADLSPGFAAKTRGMADALFVADEESLPLAPGSVDLVASCLSLHWVNDLPGALVQIRRALRPDGLFLAALFGADTLDELRRALLEAEIAVSGGAAPRVSPFVELADAAALLQRAGFALPVADADTLTVTYGDAFALMRDLRGMGEQSALCARPRSFTRRQTLMEAAARYQASCADGDGRIPATFRVLFLTGWAPSPEQQRPLRPGSAETSLADALETQERPAGDPPGEAGD